MPNTESLALKRAFDNAGFGTSAEGLYEHFEQFGNYENISPSSYFIAEEYYYNKAVNYFPQGTRITEQHVQSMKLAFEEAKLSAWDHYALYGWKEGISPSTHFDGPAYMAAKLAKLQVEEPTNDWTMTKLVEAFEESGFSPLTHYFAYGQFEGLNFDIGNPNVPVGTTQNLTFEYDALYGTNSSDYFFANVGQLNDGDYIDGRGSYDTLEAYLKHDTGALQPTLLSVEKVILRAQDVAQATGTNLVRYGYAWDVAVDATNIEGKTASHYTGLEYLQNDNSRAALAVEDIRSDSNLMTIAWTNSDPGVNVDYGVFFDPQHLKAAGAQQSSTLRLEIMDVKNSEANQVHSLEENVWNTFSFRYTPSGATESVTISLKAEDKDSYTGDDATIDTLIKAFQDALAASEWADQFTITKEADPYPGAASSGGEVWAYEFGHRIIITANSGVIEADSWSVDGDSSVPARGGIAWGYKAQIDQDCPLITTNIYLDNVGRVQWDDASPECLPNNSIYGSESGDMVVGSMANRGGIERFDVVVDRGSWLSSLSSTNETLRYVQVRNGDVNANGNLFIGSQLDDNPHFGYMVDVANKGTVPANEGPDSSYLVNDVRALEAQALFQWTDRAFLLSTDGLEDVKVLDAKDYQGNLNIGASLTLSSFEKYLRDVDGTNDGYAPDGHFVYDLGAKGDILNMAVNAGLAADNDFNLDINAGAENDFVNFRFTNQNSNGDPLAVTDNQIRNSNALDNVVINGDAGNDTVKVWGPTALTVNGGTGDDVIFVSQNADRQSDASANIIMGEQNAVFVFNAGAPDDRGILSTNIGAQSLFNDILSTVPEISYAGAKASEAIQVRVNFKGFNSSWITIDTHTTTVGDGTGRLDTLDVNAAIIEAINTNAVLSKVLVAKDGAGASLLVESLIDGTIGTDELTIAFRGNSTNSTVAVDDSGIANDGAIYTDLYGTNYATDGHDDLGITVDWARLDSDADNPAYTFIFDHGVLNAGNYLAVRVNDVVYYAANALGDAAEDGITDEDIVAALTTARDENGVMLNSIYTIADIAPANGQEGITITPIDLTDYTRDSTAELFRMEPTWNNVTGNNAGTHSLNRVHGGEGNDLFVLNANSTPEWYDVLEYHGINEGNDRVFNFQVGADKIDFSTYGSTHAVVLNQAITESKLTERQAATILNDSYAANQKGGALVQDGTTDRYWVVKVSNDGTAALTEQEVTVVGSVTFDSNTELLSVTDLV